jgi:hypothetical protein
VQLARLLELVTRFSGCCGMPLHLQSRKPASEYRSRAEQYERQAAKTKDSGEKAHFLELVRVYRKLAEKTAQLEAKKDD